MTAQNLINWNRYSTLGAVVAGRETITAPMLAKLVSAKQRREAPYVPMSAEVYDDLTKAMLRGYVMAVASGVES